MVPPFPHPLWLARGRWVSLPCFQRAWCPEPSPGPDWGGTAPLEARTMPVSPPQGPQLQPHPVGLGWHILGARGESCPCPVPVLGARAVQNPSLS